VELAPEHRLALPNLSIVLAKMRRFREAADVARRALRVVPGMAKMQYILAIGLLDEHKGSPEAIKNLQSAATEIPKAHLVAAEVLAEAGRRDEAALELEEYLRTQPADDAERGRVQARLAELRP
jgi:tetratricopeptide (TPR) repeat protein